MAGSQNPEATERSPLLSNSSSTQNANSSQSSTDMFGFHYTQANHSNPVSPKHVVTLEEQEAERRIPPITHSTLHSFPPAFSQDSSGYDSSSHNNESNDTFWDFLCHSIETISSTGIIGVLGSICIIVVLLTFIPGVTLIPSIGGGLGILDFPGAVQQALVSNISQIHIEDISNDYISVKVEGSVFFNYSQVESDSAAGTSASIMQMLGGGLLHTISIKESRSQLYVQSGPNYSWDENNNNGHNRNNNNNNNNHNNHNNNGGRRRPEYKKVVVGHVPEIDDISLQDLTPTNFSIVLNFTNFDNPSLISQTIRKFVTKQDIPIKYQTKVSLFKGYFPFGSYPVDIETVIKPSETSKKRNELTKMLQNMKLLNLEINPVERTNTLSDLESKPSALALSAIIGGNFKLPIPIRFQVPRLHWNVGIPGCNYEEDKSDVVKLTEVDTLPINIDPAKQGLNIKLESVVRQVSNDLNRICHASNHSAMDIFLQQYISGEKTNAIIYGSQNQRRESLPWWMSELMPHVKFAFPIPQRNTSDSEDKIVQKISFSNLKLILPPPRSPFDKPNLPRQPPKISAHVAVVIHPPSMLNLTKDIGIDIQKVKGFATLISPETKVRYAEFDIRNWLPCTTTVRPVNPGDADDGPVDTPGDGESDQGKKKGVKKELIDYVVEFELTEIPMKVLDQSTLSSVATQLLMKGQVPVNFDAIVDLELDTPVKTFLLNRIPLEGSTTMTK